MGRTTIDAFIIGERGIRAFSFLVDTGSTYVGLPLEDIEALGLPRVPGGEHQVMTATGFIEQDSYGGGVRIDEVRTPAIVIISPIPVIGYEVLENLRMKVNPITQEHEKIPDGEYSPPYRLSRIVN